MHTVLGVYSVHTSVGCRPRRAIAVAVPVALESLALPVHCGARRIIQFQILGRRSRWVWSGPGIGKFVNLHWCFHGYSSLLEIHFLTLPPFSSYISFYW